MAWQTTVLICATPSSADGSPGDEVAALKETIANQIVIRASGTMYQNPPRAMLRLDGVIVGEIVVSNAVSNGEVPASPAAIDAAETTIVLPLDMPECPRLLEITFLNDEWAGDGLTGDTNLFVGRVSIGEKFYYPWQFGSATDGAGEAGARLFALWRAGTVPIPLDPGPECIAQGLTAPSPEAKPLP